MAVTFPCPYCHKPIYLPEDAVLTQAASIHNSRRKVHGGGRPRGYRKCPRCGKFHQKEEMLKCIATAQV